MSLTLIVVVLAICLALMIRAAKVRQVSLLKDLESRLVKLETQVKELPQKTKESIDGVMAYGWFDEGWPGPVKGDELTPFENPDLGSSADEYTAQIHIAEYNAMNSPRDRIKFIKRLCEAKRTAFAPGLEWSSLDARLLDIVYSDESPFVRAWAAAHLASSGAQKKDYEAALQSDPSPIVRAALRSNPNHNQLPWQYGGTVVPEDVNSCFCQLSQLERLGLMRNPELSEKFVLMLLRDSSESLGLSQKEHVEVLTAAAQNPELILSSRNTGRDSWIGRHGDCFGATHEFAEMWDVCLERWMDSDVSRVAYLFFELVQTTPKKKLEVYNALLGGQHEKASVMRSAVINSCDPQLDSAILRAAWSDPDQWCRKYAAARVGKFSKLVGVEEATP